MSLELPTRLRIQTIDSLNHELARAMPLLGRLQSSLDVVDDARELYLQAARNTLRGTDADAEQLEDIDELLRRLDNDWDRAEQLLAGLLASRGRWLPVLLDVAPMQLADRIEASLERIINETLQGAATALRARTCSRKLRGWRVPVQPNTGRAPATCAGHGAHGWIRSAAWMRTQPT